MSCSWPSPSVRLNRGQAADALRALIHAANQAREQGLDAVPDQEAAAGLRLSRSAVLAGLQEARRVPGAKAKQEPGRTLLECLRDREADILRFLSDLRIPPTSSQAERDLRPAKTQQKASKAARNRHAVRGCASAAVKHGADALTAIRDAHAGTPGCRPSRKPPGHACRHSRTATGYQRSRNDLNAYHARSGVKAAGL